MNSIITPPPLESIGAQTLMEEVLEQRPWLIDGLLPIPSTALLCSPPKYGKSLLSLKAGHCVATGSDFLNKKVERAGVAYLCLEDQAHRLQQRLWQLADESSDRLRLITRAETLGHGLIEQMQRFLEDYEDTKLFIIDTLQITRDSTTDYSYASDYADLRKYKSFADDNGVCVLIVNAVRRLWKNSVIDAPTFALFAVVFALSVASPYLPVRVGPAAIVVASLCFGILWNRGKRAK